MPDISCGDVMSNENHTDALRRRAGIKRKSISICSDVVEAKFHQLETVSKPVKQTHVKHSNLNKGLENRKVFPRILLFISSHFMWILGFNEPKEYEHCLNMLILS